MTTSRTNCMLFIVTANAEIFKYFSTFFAFKFVYRHNPYLPDIIKNASFAAIIPGAKVWSHASDVKDARHNAISPAL